MVGTRISHSGQGWYTGRHRQLTIRSELEHRGRHMHLTFRSGLVHRGRHTHLTFMSGLVHRSAPASHIRVRAGTSVGTRISQSDQGWCIGVRTRISHSGQGWYISRHRHRTIKSGLVLRSAQASNNQIRAGTSGRYRHLTFRSGLVHQSAQVSHNSDQGWYFRVGTCISHSGQGWYISRHRHLTIR